jgi:hypothetical protein
VIELKPANSGGYRAYLVEGPTNACVGDIQRSEDGYFYWWPMGLGGCWQAYILSGLADKLDELNAEWDAQVRRECCGPSSESTGPNYTPSTSTEAPF